jgi:hypothetical protein
MKSFVEEMFARLAQHAKYALLRPEQQEQRFRH